MNAENSGTKDTESKTVTRWHSYVRRINHQCHFQTRGISLVPYHKSIWGSTNVKLQCLTNKNSGKIFT